MTKEMTDSLKEDQNSLNLLEATTPEMYRQNAFRVLALPVDATMRDIKRRQMRLEACRKLGTKPSNGEHAYLPLDLPPDEDEISRAIQRLQDPRARLLEEMFWFWPQSTNSADDPGLKLLTTNRWSETLHLWQRLETSGSDGKTSIHNLAVLYHAIALDLECKAGRKHLSERENDAHCLYWKQALAYWQRLLDDEVFWSRLTARIRDIKDPRLTTGTAHRIRQSLPKVLLMVNALLALEAAEKGRTQDTQRHIMIMQKSQFDRSLVYEVLRKAVHDVRQRLKTMCAETAAKADKDPTHASKMAAELLKEAAPLLSVVDQLLPKEDFARVNAHDEVATVVAQCQIIYGNKTEDWKTSLGLLQDVLCLAGSESVLTRIRKNIEIMTNNLNLKLCFFCGRNQGDDSATFEVAMYGDVQRMSTGYNSYRTTWRHVKIKVPRCSECKTHHTKMTNWTAGLGVLGGIGGGVIGLAISAAVDNPLFLFLLAAIGAIAGSIVGHQHARSKVPSDYRPLSKKAEYPVIKDLLSQGWCLGERPPQ